MGGGLGGSEASGLCVREAIPVTLIEKNWICDCRFCIDMKVAKEFSHDIRRLRAENSQVVEAASKYPKRIVLINTGKAFYTLRYSKSTGRAGNIYNKEFEDRSARRTYGDLPRIFAQPHSGSSYLCCHVR